MIRMILAEKPDQARAYAKALGRATTRGPLSIIKHSEYLEGEIHIVAARGHLYDFDIAAPKWALENFPNVDVDFKTKAISGDPDIARRLKVIREQAKLVDEIIIGTDSDREGERIAHLILEHIPGALKKATKRLWIHSLTDAAIQDSAAHLRNSSETELFYEEAEARAESDWLVGYNLSPVVTLDLQRQQKLKRAKGNSMSVGRVQTPTVRLIVENDRAITNFRSTTFWKLELMAGKAKFTSDIKFNSEEEGEAALANLSRSAVVKAVVAKHMSKAAPKLYSLSTLQAHAAKKWNMSSDRVLATVQSLYEKKHLTYPRTASNFITHGEYEQLVDSLVGYQDLLDLHFDVTHPEARKQYVDDAKVKEHFAIIPTPELPDMDALTADEKTVYTAVTMRTIMMFAADFQYDSTTVTLTDAGVDFAAKGQVTRDPGYRVYTGATTENKELPDFQPDQTVQVQPNLVEGKTKPPARITESSLLGKWFPKYNLGTEATHAAIIKTIQDRRYVVKDKKTGEFKPTQRAFILIDYLAGNEFSNPNQTGQWEKFLKQIGEGNVTREKFVNGIKAKLREQITKIKEER